MGKDRSRTPIPSRVIEYNSTGTSGVREYKLSPEELEEVRQKYPATARDKKFVKPIVQNIPTKGEKRMGKFTMTEAEFKAARVSGKTIAKIAEEQDVTEATVYNSMRRWEAAAGKDSEDVPEDVEKQEVLREKKVAPPANNQQLDKAIHEIERLTAELLKAREERDGYKKRYEEQAATSQNHFLRVVSLEDINNRLTHEVSNWQRQSENGKVQIERERDVLQNEINRMITERDELVTENDRLQTELLIVSQANPEPATEVHLLDRSIAELTRAKWILKRLNASGE